jgi:DNA invertase Pin-like site-specific DNA recombinase
MGIRTKKKAEIEERRENILNLQSMGYSQYAIIEKLGITKMTMSRDMRSTGTTTTIRRSTIISE